MRDTIHSLNKLERNDLEMVENERYILLIMDNYLSKIDLFVPPKILRKTQKIIISIFDSKGIDETSLNETSLDWN